MRILVVEDEKKIADFIKKGLQEESYSVDWAGDGEHGHYLASINQYDIILLDVMLPKMDGIALCRTLRSEKNTTPIIMLTVKDTVKDKVMGLDAGANDYVTKPFAFEELLARIRALLRSTSDQPVTVLRIHDLELNLLTHEVTRDGARIELTSKEFALLEYLMRNQGRVVTKTMITEHVWDMHFDSDTNVIAVYINFLRKKIDEDFSPKLIHTLRGRGYMIKG